MYNLTGHPVNKLTTTHLLGKFPGQGGVVVVAAEASVVKGTIRRMRRSRRKEHLATEKTN